MEIRINIEKRHVYFLSALILIFSFVNFAIAYGTTNPQNFGHSASEVGPGTFGGSANDIFSFPGKVGIGTTNPKERLQIGDRFTFHDGGWKGITYNFYWNQGDKRIVDDEVAALFMTDTGDIRLRTAPSSTVNSNINWIEAMTIKNNGNVGIGTAGPARILDISANPMEIITRASAAATNSKVWRWANTGTDLRFEAMNDDLTNGINVMTLLRTGNVGIGTTNPQNYIGWAGALDVNGQVKAARYYDDNPAYYIDANTNSYFNNIDVNGHYSKSGSPVMRCNWNGCWRVLSDGSGYDFIMKCTNGYIERICTNDDWGGGFNGIGECPTWC